MGPITTLIVDDEPLAREGVRLALKPDPLFTIVGECGNGKEAVAAIRRLRPHLVFLDVQMPELDGFGVLRKLKPEELPLVVFVTAFDDFAVAAFEARALDYVLKPLNPDRFAKTLARVKSVIVDQQLGETTKRLLALLSDSSVPAHEFLSRFTVKIGDRIQFVEAAAVDWIEADDYYAKLHAGKQTYLIRESLSRLEDQLDPAQFARIHRSTIVNLARVKELKAHFHGEYIVLLQDGSKHKLSRSYRSALARILPER